MTDNPPELVASYWHETAAIAPPEGVVVLGWWTPFTLGAVVRRKGDEWFADGPGLPFSEGRTPPRYWTLIPDPPDPPLPDRTPR